MARIRTIKPDFFTSEDIVSLSPHARLLYIATWCEADREGRLVWKPGTFKLRYFPGDVLDMESVAKELISRGLIVPYGDSLAWIPKFKQHQHLNPRESDSSLPDPDASARVGTREARAGRKGREGKTRGNGRGDASSRVNGSAFAPPDWIPEKAWQGFEQMRHKIKKPMTDRARELIVKELEKLRVQGFDPILVLEQSERNGWQDVFPLKHKGGEAEKSLIELMDEREAKRAAH